ncbi:type III-A CRISPR-associated protein Csm2 [Candidatus Alkanophaga liquidiphilum]|nr:MAG: type III-A CRISPR-associated protein Csm2 [Candidatus Alkanophagales archaeon]
MSIVDEIKRDLDAILGGDSKKLVETADKFGKHLKNKGLSTSQIRAIFTRVQRLRRFDENTLNELNLLRPKMAYAVGRHKGKVKDLQDVLDEAIQKIDNETKFKNFKEFFEAILAYHRYHGGD